jgi:hypothetical protein
MYRECFRYFSPKEIVMESMRFFRSALKTPLRERRKKLRCGVDPWRPLSIVSNWTEESQPHVTYKDCSWGVTAPREGGIPRMEAFLLVSDSQTWTQLCSTSKGHFLLNTVASLNHKRDLQRKFQH